MLFQVLGTQAFNSCVSVVWLSRSNLHEGRSPYISISFVIGKRLKQHIHSIHSNHFFFLAVSTTIVNDATYNTLPPKSTRKTSRPRLSSASPSTSSCHYYSTSSLPNAKTCANIHSGRTPKLMSRRSINFLQQTLVPLRVLKMISNIVWFAAHVSLCMTCFYTCFSINRLFLSLGACSSDHLPRRDGLIMLQPIC